MFVTKWMPYDSKELLSPQLPVIKAMHDNLDGGRVFGKIGSYIDFNYKLQSVEGYDPLYIRRYGEFIESAKNGQLASAVRSLVILDKNAEYADRVLDLLGVTVIYHVIGDTNKVWAYPVWDEKYFDKYKIVYSDDKFQVYNNLEAMPRAKIFYSYELIQEDADIIKRFYDEDFDYRNILILEKEPETKSKVNPFDRLRARIPKSKVKNIEINNSVIIKSYKSNSIIIEVETERAGVLFLSDSYYPNWRARVNGKEVEVLRANYAFRGVPIKAGESVVEFYFDPF